MCNIQKHRSILHNTSIDFINRPKEFGSKVTKINVSSPGCTGRFSHRTSVQPQEGRTSRINKGTSPVLQIRKEICFFSPYLTISRSIVSPSIRIVVGDDYNNSNTSVESPNKNQSPAIPTKVSVPIIKIDRIAPPLMSVFIYRLG